MRKSHPAGRALVLAAGAAILLAAAEARAADPPSVAARAAGDASADAIDARLPEWARTAEHADLLRAKTAEVMARTAADDERTRRRAELAALDEIARARDPSSAIEAYSRAKCLVRREPLAAKAFVRRMTEMDLPELADRQAKEVVAVELDDPLARAVIATTRARDGDAEGAMTAIARAVLHDSDDPFIRRTAGRIAAWRDTRREGRMAADLEVTFQRVCDTVGATPEFAAAYRAAVAAYAAERGLAPPPATTPGTAEAPGSAAPGAAPVAAPGAAPATPDAAVAAPPGTPPASGAPATATANTLRSPPAAVPVAATRAVLISDAVPADYRLDGLDDPNLYYGSQTCYRPSYVVVSWGWRSAYARCYPTRTYTSSWRCAPRASSTWRSHRSSRHSWGWRSRRR